MTRNTYFKKLLFCFFAIQMPFYLAAQTPLSGFQISDITLTLEDSPYELVDNYITTFGTVLTIEAGVEIRCPSPDFYIQVFGSLLAIGTESNNIKIWGNHPSSNVYGGRIELRGGVACQMEWVNIERMGSPRPNPNPDIETDTMTSAILVYFSGLEMNNCNIINTPENAIAFKYGTLNCSNTCFEDIGTYGIFNYSIDGSEVSASNNYWGDATGPYHPNLNSSGQGAMVSGGIDFTPFDIGCRDNTPPSDLAVTEFVNPISSCTYTQPQHVEIKITNEGDIAESNFPVKYTLNGNTTTATFTGTIQPGETLSFIFPQVLNLNNVGNYNFEVFTDLTDDQNPSNDILNTTIEHLPQVDVNITGDRELCVGENTVLGVAYHSNYEYEWSNGSSSHNIYISPTENTTYSVTVVDDSYPGCMDIASVDVAILEAADTPIAFASSNIICANGEVTLTSFGITDNLIWSTGETGESISIDQAGYYYVTHIGENGCSATSQHLYIGIESAPHISYFGDGIICGNESETLIINFGSNFEWSTGEITQSISVMPAESTTYIATVTTSNNCTHIIEKTVTIASEIPANGVSNMSPFDGAENISLPIPFSWTPGDNATHYEVYIWNENNTEPNSPTFTTTQTILAYAGFLQYGNTYKWKVCAKNICSPAAPVCSDIHTFTLNELPDLVVEEINAPTSVFSGTTFEVSWEVKNTGNGSTNAIINNANWQDVCYLSSDSIRNSNDIYLGTKLNTSALSSGTGYTSPSLLATLPNGIQGKHFIIVCTDKYHDIPESNEQNNCRISPISLDIQLSPYADLYVDPTPVITGAAGGIVFAGSAYELQWTVENRDNGLNSAVTSSDWWYDKVYLSTSPFFNIQDIQSEEIIQHQGNLEIGNSYSSTTTINIPDIQADTIYAYVCTDATNREYEYVFEDNNCRRSEPLTIIGLPKPDFLMENITTPDTASNRESIEINWVDKNEGAAYSGELPTRFYISNQTDFSDWYTAVGSSSQFVSLPNEGSFPRQTNIQIPSSISGKYYLLGLTNPTQNILESDFTNNTILDSICIISPNLTVANISSIPDVISGETITFEWEVTNTGEGDFINTSLHDKVRLIDANNPEDFISIYLGGAISISSNGSVVRQKTYTIPHWLEGDYCIEVHTNYTENAYENGQYADNILFTCDTLHITETLYPNLVAENINAAMNTFTAGDDIEISFTVKNDQEGAAEGFWKDRIYLSTDDELPLNNYISLGNITHSQVVPANGFYNKMITAQLPASLSTGDYYLYLFVDNEFTIFENDLESDNIIRSEMPINVSVYPSVDLKFEGQPESGEILLGQTTSIHYGVKNTGTVPTINEIWKDGLYLSPSSTWDASHILISEWQRNGVLDTAETYEVAENYMLPAGFTDAFYLFLVIDHENVVAETSDINNVKQILQSNGEPVIITYPPSPDLTITGFVTPSTGTAGQFLNLAYTVKNIETIGNAQGNWTESFWLSTNPTLSGNDIFLGAKNHSDGLVSGVSYNDNITLTLPLAIAGNYFLIVKTDANNLLSETDENNNTQHEPIFITQPLPGDLLVLENEIEAPAIDTIATNITISWKVKNIGQNPVSGYMTEGIYLSEDETWDVADVLLDTWSGIIGLDPNASTSHAITTRLENVKRTDYHVFIKTDLLDNFLENNENNNTGKGPATVFVDVPELPIGLPVTSTTMAFQQPIYYRIEIPTNFIAETMKITLSSNDSNAFNELYVRHNEIPTRTMHDFTFSIPFEENQEIIIPSLEPGTYYIMGYAVEGSPVQDIGLLAEIIPFQITSIEANSGGNTGNVTVILKGAKFHEGMDVWLEDNILGNIGAANVEVLSAVKAFVTFPLDGENIGIYDVKAENNAAQIATLANGFEVRTGTIGNSPLLTSCALDLGNQILSINDVPASVSILGFEATYPPNVRPNQTVKITLSFRNTGDVDIPSPSRVFSSLSGFPLAETIVDLDQNMENLNLNITEEGGPQDVLRPGGIAHITVYSKATSSEGVLKFQLLPN